LAHVILSLRFLILGDILKNSCVSCVTLSVDALLLGVFV